MNSPEPTDGCRNPDAVKKIQQHMNRALDARRSIAKCDLRQRVAPRRHRRGGAGTG